VRVNHVEVALVDRDIGRFADGAARMVQPGARLGELDQVLEVRQRAVATALVHVHDERRAVGRSEHHRIAADDDRIGRIARMLGKLLWRCFEDFVDHAGFELNIPGAAGDRGHVRAGAGEQLYRFRVITELDADFGKNGIGGLLDLEQTFFVQKFVGGNPARDIRHHKVLVGLRSALTRRAPGSAPLPLVTDRCRD